jgi:hypothetical protein
MKNKQIDGQLIIEIVPTHLKIFLGAIASFLILFGIHWIAIITGIVLGAVYYLIPKKY